MLLIMEDGINVDDLFGEPSSLDLGFPSAASTKGLAQRLDELRTSGCCQKIAWSRLGCIAYISQDGSQVNLRHLHCRPSDGRWVLSDEVTSLHVSDVHAGLPLVHLLWNETGSELAVVDSSGRLSVHTITVAVNQIAAQRQAAFDPEDDENQVVGLMWLSVQRSSHAFHQAAKVNGRWTYSPFRRRPAGPFHPANKPALICVTRSGLVRLVYQDTKWTEVSTELKHTGYSDRLLTHAAIVATPANNTIIIATHSACGKQCLYQMLVTWNPPQWDPAQVKQGTSPSLPTPGLHIFHRKVEMPCEISTTDRDMGENPDDSSPYSNPIYNLTHLEIIPGPSENTANISAVSWVVAVFSSPIHATPDYPVQQGPSSVIVRWQLDTVAQTLHSKFDEVPSKKNNDTQTKPKFESRRMEDIHFDRHIVSIDYTEYGNTLTVVLDDGSIVHYDPRNMTPLEGLADPNTVTSLAQAGFHYPPESSILHIAFSPGACVAVVLDGDWRIQTLSMEHSFGLEGGQQDGNKFSAAIAALTLAFCRGCGSDVNTDDILLIALRQLSPEDRITFINEIYRALPVNCNFTEEQDKLMNHPYVPRCLSIQAALGFQNKYKPRSPTSVVPWAILHLRHASMLFAFFFQYSKGAQTDPLDLDVLRMVFGNTRWTLDFLHYILNGLFDLADELENDFDSAEAFAQKVKSTASLPLIIVLSSMSRAFLRFICRGLRGIYAGYATSATLSGDARVYYGEICHALDTSPVRVDVYERLLAGVDSAVRHTYQAAAFGEAERPGPEKELIVNARISPVFIPAVSTILRQTIAALKPEINRMAIYLGDYSWLGFGDDPRSELYRRSRDVDILKKVPLRKPVMLPSSSSLSTTTPAGIGIGMGSSRKGSIASEHTSGKPVISIPTPNHPTNPTATTTANAGNTTTPSQSQSNRRRRCVRCCEVTGDAAFPRTMLSLRMVLKLGLLRSCLCGGMLAVEPSGGAGAGAGVGGTGSGSSQLHGAHVPSHSRRSSIQHPGGSVHSGQHIAGRTPGMASVGLGGSG